MRFILLFAALVRQQKLQYAISRITFLRKDQSLRFVFLTQLSVRFFFCVFIRFSMNIWKLALLLFPCLPAEPACTCHPVACALLAYASVLRARPRQLAAGGLKWTRTTDLALIRRAL